MTSEGAGSDLELFSDGEILAEESELDETSSQLGVNGKDHANSIVPVHQVRTKQLS